MPAASHCPPLDRAATPFLLLLSAAFLGHALQLGNGTIYNSPDQTLPFNSSLGWVTASYLACLLAGFLPRIDALERFAQKNFSFFAFLAITWQFYTLLTASPGAFLQVNVFRTLQDFILFITLAFACAASAFGSSPPLRGLTVPLFLFTFTLAGLWLLRVDTNPPIDVHLFHHESTVALLHGADPYTLTFPDMYGQKFGGHEYGAKIAANGRVLVGFPYMPLTLIFSTLAQAFYQDYRLAHLLALPIAAALMILSRRTRYSLPAAALFLLTPRIFFVLEQGYTEPFVVLFLAATIYGACRNPRHINWLFGLFLASKQYAILCLPFALLFHPSRRARARLVLISLLVAAAITLPFFLWNPPGFFRSVVMMQFRQPFRDDSLSYLAWISQNFHIVLPSLTGFAAAAIVGVLAYLGVPRTPAGIATAISLEFFTFFAFNKQAFANYYLFVIGAMCCAIAATAVTGAILPAVKPSDSPSHT